VRSARAYAGIHIRLYRLHDGTAHLPFGAGPSFSQFTIGTSVRLLSGHGGLPGHASSREAGRSAGRREDNRPHAAGVRRAVGETGSPGKYSARDPDRPPCRASGQISGPSQINSEGPDNGAYDNHLPHRISLNCCDSVDFQVG
jgi:hypothetical protein